MSMRCICLALLYLSVPAHAQSTAEQNWPRWRGPYDSGVAPHATPPLTWSETENVRWKVALPGHGHSTPVVWGDRLFVTASVAYGEVVRPRRHDAAGAHDNHLAVRPQKSIVMAVSRKDGAILWRKEVRDGVPHEGGHKTGSHASASPVTDGKRVIAYFGSRGLHALDFDGKLLWSVDLGEMETKHAHGEGASPTLHGDLVVVNWDHEGQSFVAAFDAKTGAEKWRRARAEVSSWASPVVVPSKVGPQLIVSGTKSLRSYDLATGGVLWECGGLAHNVVASPVHADGIVYAASSYEKQAMLAIRVEGAKGDLTRSGNLLWVRRRRTPYVPSPLLYDGTLYMLNHYQGRLSRVQALTGAEPKGPWRIAGIGNVYASPLGAADRIYVTDLAGVTVVLSHEAVPRVLATNRLDDSFSASPAAVGKDLYLRGARHLYCLSRK